MATKDTGSLDGDAAKSAGSLDKSPVTDTTAADSGSAYDYADYDDSSGGAYEPPVDYGSGGSDTGGGDATSPGEDSTADDSGDGESGTDDPGDEGAGSDDAGTDDPGEDDPGAGDPGDDGTGGDTEAPEDVETLPGEYPGSPETPEPPETPGPDRPNRVSIDIDLMIVLIAAMERARDEIPELVRELRTILSDLDLDPSEVAGHDRVLGWIDEQLPDLRRRLALAQALEDGDLIVGPQPRPVPVPVPTPKPRPLPVGPGRPPVVIEDRPHRREISWEEDQFAPVPPHQAAEHGRRAAALLQQDDGTGVAEATELVRTHQADPYFAREFASNTDPAFLTGSSAPEGSDLPALVRATVATAGRATGELAMDDETREAWAGALS